ncbi:hypothetical protein Dimus_024954 [Dionaea muscipula]
MKPVVIATPPAIYFKAATASDYALNACPFDQTYTMQDINKKLHPWQTMKLSEKLVQECLWQHESSCLFHADNVCCIWSSQRLDSMLSTSDIMPTSKGCSVRQIFPAMMVVEGLLDGDRGVDGAGSNEGLLGGWSAIDLLPPWRSALPLRWIFPLRCR